MKNIACAPGPAQQLNPMPVAHLAARGCGMDYKEPKEFGRQLPGIHAVKDS